MQREHEKGFTAFKELMAKLPASTRRLMRNDIATVVEALGYKATEHKYLGDKLTSWRHLLPSWQVVTKEMESSQTKRRELERRYYVENTETFRSALLTLSELSEVMAIPKSSLQGKLSQARGVIRFGATAYDGDHDQIGSIVTLEVAKSTSGVIGDVEADARAAAFMRQFKRGDSKISSKQRGTRLAGEQEAARQSLLQGLPEPKFAAPRGLTAKKRSSVSKPGKPR